MGATGSKQDVGEERGDEDEGSNMYIPSYETEPLLKPLKGLSPPLVLLPPIPHSLFQHLVLWIKSLIKRILKAVKLVFWLYPAYGDNVWDFINELKSCIDEERHMAFDRSSSDHLEMLTRLWNCLKLGEEPPSGSDFSPLGFQNGLRPETDLRGMGMLALHHLVFFAECATDRALGVMSASNATYFPFAATGVTFTALCVRLLNEGRLDELLLKVCSDWLEKGGVTTTTPVPNKEGMRLIDGVYVELYTAFGDFWISQMPSSIMEFPKLYSQFEKHVNMCLPVSCGYRQTNEEGNKKKKKTQ